MKHQWFPTNDTRDHPICRKCASVYISCSECSKEIRDFKERKFICECGKTKWVKEKC